MKSIVQQITDELNRTQNKIETLKSEITHLTVKKKGLDQALKNLKKSESGTEQTPPDVPPAGILPQQ